MNRIVQLKEKTSKLPNIGYIISNISNFGIKHGGFRGLKQQRRLSSGDGAGRIWFEKQPEAESHGQGKALANW
jgi:hypothetical protein